VLGELPNLFDRNFAIGFFLPVVLFAAISYALMEAFHLSSLVSFLRTENPLASTAISLVLTWLIAALLLAMNRSLYMLLEGYGRFNPARLLAGREKRRYRKLLDEKSRLEQAYRRESNNPAKQEEILSRLGDINLTLAEQFPDNEDFLLPTRFGNTLRAFEVYPRVLYGLEAIQGWNRVLAVIPQEYRDVVNVAKAQTDFWLNLWALSLLAIVEYVGFTMAKGPTLYWFPVAALLIALFAAWWARIAAIEWGDGVKASFDVFLLELGKHLGFPPNATREEQKRLWSLFSNVIIRRSERALDLLNREIDQMSPAAHDGSGNLMERIYTVQPGDTFSDIAQRFGITVEALAKANDVDNTEDVVSVGQQLRVPHA
jgi:LysM domain